MTLTPAPDTHPASQRCECLANLLQREAGVPGSHGKEPEVIAVAAAAQLLQTLVP